MLEPTKIKSFNMELDKWEYKSCIALFGTGKNWATLYSIESKEKRKGHAEKILLAAKTYYTKLNKLVGGSVALNDPMKLLYKKVGYLEYN